MRYYLPGFPQQDEEVQTSGKEVKKIYFFQTNLSLEQTQTFQTYLSLGQTQTFQTYLSLGQTQTFTKKLCKLYEGIQF